MHIFVIFVVGYKQQVSRFEIIKLLRLETIKLFQSIFQSHPNDPYFIVFKVIYILYLQIIYFIISKGRVKGSNECLMFLMVIYNYFK